MDWDLEPTRKTVLSDSRTTITSKGNSTEKCFFKYFPIYLTTLHLIGSTLNIHTPKNKPENTNVKLVVGMYIHIFLNDGMYIINIEQ